MLIQLPSGDAVNPNYVVRCFVQGKTLTRIIGIKIETGPSIIVELTTGIQIGIPFETEAEANAKFPEICRLLSKDYISYLGHEPQTHNNGVEKNEGRD